MNFFGSSSLEDFDVSFNTEGWGPVNGKKIQAFEEVPYAHFDKKEKINRIAEFGQSQMMYQKPMRYRRGDEANSNADFVYRHDAQEDNTFQLVDSAKTATKKTNAPKRTWNQQNRNAGAGKGRGFVGRPGSNTGRPDNNFNNRNGGRGKMMGKGKGMKKKADRVPSLSVLQDWVLREEFDLSQLLKLAANVPKVEELASCGHVDHYDESYDKVNVRGARPLRRINDKIFYGHVTTSDDPMIGNYAAEGAAEFFATDAILAQLMAAPRSVYSWDLVIQKFNGMVFFDKRDGSTLDYLTVSETARDPPTVSDEIDEINHPAKLSIEATTINQNFCQQILKEDAALRKSFEPNPFYEPEEDGLEPASVAYRYRKFTLGEHTLIARCELHGWLKKHNEEQMMTAYALNEWDSKYCDGIVWRQKIDQQRGAVLATELKNNSCKLAKWTAQSIISGADQMRVGYVSRVTPKDANDHVVLATQFFKPKELAMQINLSLPNIWGIIKMIFELVKGMDDGKYVLLKDPNKPTMRLYSVPLNTFEEEDEEGEGEEAEGGEGEGARDEAVDEVAVGAATA